ncbi:uncharacterized protein LOC131843361 [Achroia grisella]|uniref:uncharacterized protein LOC131843361 n=1 Tax=Achroia grisella TaxID=688607 RepID=UPI0027D23555|nr:uncharacterized protein LOC131843361 [Achroia grisella]
MAPAPSPPPIEGPPVDSGGNSDSVAKKATKEVMPELAVCLGRRLDMNAHKGAEESMEVGNLAQELGGPCTRSRASSVTGNLIEFVRPSETSVGGRKKRRLDNGAEYDSADSATSSVDMEIAGLAVKKGKTPKEGRQYVGPGAAKAALTKDRRKEFLRVPGSDSEGDDEAAEPRTVRSGVKAPRNPTDPAEVHLHKVREAMVEKTMEVLGVVKKSGNLKGTCQKQIKSALARLNSLAESLDADLIPRSVTPLLKRNSDIESELHKLRKENEELRARVAAAPPPENLRPTPVYNHGAYPRRGNDWDTFRSQIMEDVGRMMERQTAELMRQVRSMVAPQPVSVDMDDQVPDYVYRPPLQNGDKIEAYRQQGNIRPGVGPQPSGSKAPQSASRKKAGKVGQSQPTSSKKTEATTASQQSTAAVESWATVVRKNGRTTSVPEPKAGPSGTQGKGKTGSQTVILALPQEAEKAGATYAGILREAKAKIDLASLGIEELRFKSAATGARILEIPGSQSGGKADALAQKLREVLGENPVQVSRPTKTAEMRIMGLDDSVTPEDITHAVARDGECAPEEVKAGEIRLNPSGLGTCWVRAPILVVKKITTAARIKVGWVSAPVELLRQRPLRCFKCLQTGHVRMRCPQWPLLQMQQTGPQSRRLHSSPELRHLPRGRQAGGSLDGE